MMTPRMYFYRGDNLNSEFSAIIEGYVPTFYAQHLVEHKTKADNLPA